MDHNCITSGSTGFATLTRLTWALCSGKGYDSISSKIKKRQIIGNS